MPPDLSVVVCTLNGSSGIGRCLAALTSQSNRERIEIVVVDDGSTDNTAEIAREYGVTVISHPRNLGLSAARNTGVNAASADIVAFVDDDCEPDQSWAERLLASYTDDVAGVGGPVAARCEHWYLAGFLTRHNPIAPLELNLAVSNSIPYRFYLYLQRMWSGQQYTGSRDVHAFAGANMSFRKKVIFEAGLFDDRFRFGGEDVEFCMRVRQSVSPARLVFNPEARVTHYFKPDLSDTLRRSRAYGIGNARLRRKWSSVPPIVFPWPALVLLVLIAAVWVPPLVIAALLLPLVLYPAALRGTFKTRNPVVLLDSYIQLAQEACANVGILQGTWRFRKMERGDPAAEGQPL
jgi:glycosyltransferase involved in cell wall biosynthesis